MVHARPAPRFWLHIRISHIYYIHVTCDMHLTCMMWAKISPVTSYDTPLDQARMAAEQPEARARLCDRLETMWQGLQQDIETQREESERGADPRLLQLQLQCIKIQAALWRMTAAPLPEPAPEKDPEAEAHDAQAEAARILAQVSSRL